MRLLRTSQRRWQLPTGPVFFKRFWLLAIATTLVLSNWWRIPVEKPVRHDDSAEEKREEGYMLWEQPGWDPANGNDLGPCLERQTTEANTEESHYELERKVKRTVMRGYTLGSRDSYHQLISYP